MASDNKLGTVGIVRICIPVKGFGRLAAEMP